MFAEWAAISEIYNWGIEEIKSISPRERKNWLELAKVKAGRKVADGV